MRSQFEKAVSGVLPGCKYEAFSIPYTMTYTPDFADPDKGILYEVKGVLRFDDAAKLLKIKDLLPFACPEGKWYNEIIIIPMVSNYELRTWDDWRTDTHKAKSVPMRSGKQLCWWCTINGFRYYPASSEDTTRLAQELTDVRSIRFRRRARRSMESRR